LLLPSAVARLITSKFEFKIPSSESSEHMIEPSTWCQYFSQRIFFISLVYFFPINIYLCSVLILITNEKEYFRDFFLYRFPVCWDPETPVNHFPSIETKLNLVAQSY